MSPVFRVSGVEDQYALMTAMAAGKPYPKAGSIPKRRAVLFSIFSFAVARSVVAVNPVDRAIEKKTRTNREKRPQVGLSEAQFTALLDAP